MRGIRPYWRVGALAAGALALLLLALPLPPAAAGEAGLGFSLGGAALVQKAKGSVFAPLLLAALGDAGRRRAAGQPTLARGRRRAGMPARRRAYLLYGRLQLDGG